jgi:transposase
LEQRYRRTRSAVERSRWQLLRLLAQDHTATQIATVTGYSAYWIGQIARRYNQQGPAGVEDRRHALPGRARLLSATQQAELQHALSGPPPHGEYWTGRTVAEWMAERLGRPVWADVGRAYLDRLDRRRYAPRPRHVQADPAAQEAFKGGSAS